MAVRLGTAPHDGLAWTLRRRLVMKRQMSGWAVAGLFLTAAVVGLFPVVDLVLQVWPVRLGEVTWRYGAVGIGAGYLPSPVFGVAVLVAVSYWREQAVTLRIAGYLALAAAVLILPLMLLFAVDLMQVQGMRPEGQQRAALISGGVQELKYLVASVTLGALGIGALRTSTQMTSQADRAGATSKNVLIGEPD